MNKILVAGFIFFLSFTSRSTLAHQWLKPTEISLKQNRHKLSRDSLLHYARSTYSQYGEDGIIEEIFKRLKIKRGFFVEFGAANGMWLSNTKKLHDEGWGGCFIEAKYSRFKELQQNYASSKNVLCLNHFIATRVSPSQGLTFDTIKERHFPSQDIDFLSIDIDGLDYYVLESLKCRPKVICIEINLLWHPKMTKMVPVHIAAQKAHQPIPVYCRLAESMGYVPICCTNNLFLVRKDLYEPFAMIQNDPLTLWLDAIRVLPIKKHIVSRRKTLKLIKKYEGKKPLLPLIDRQLID